MSDKTGRRVRNPFAGKKKLYEWLTVQGFQPRMEVFLSALNQQPDLLFEWGGKKLQLNSNVRSYRQTKSSGGH